MKSQEIEGITKTDYEHLNVFIPLQVPKLYKALGEPFYLYKFRSYIRH